MVAFYATPEQRRVVILGRGIGRAGHEVITRGRHLRFLLPEDQRSAPDHDALAQLGTGAWVSYNSHAAEVDTEYSGI